MFSVCFGCLSSFCRKCAKRARDELSTSVRSRAKCRSPEAEFITQTKHAIEAIDEALRIEVSSFNIQVIGILPGPVNTNFDEVAVAQILDTGKDSPYYIFKHNLAKATREMLKPGGTGVLEPEDIAAKIVEAATATSPSARYHVGAMSKVMGRAHDLLPDVIWDAAMKMMAPSMDKKD